MRWISLLFLLLAPYNSYGVNINNPEAIMSAIDDQSSFSFFYIGHAYGAHNDAGKDNKIAYPHPEIIRIIDQLRQYNFGVFGGDVVEICNKKSVEAFEELLVKPLGLPLINSMGNHDKCLKNFYGFPDVQTFTKGGNTFLIINTALRNLDKKYISWLHKQIEKFNQQTNAKRLFIFTHRPSFLLLDPSLKEAIKYANSPVTPDLYFTDTIQKSLLDLDKNKDVFWFAGDLGKKISYVYKKLGYNVHLIGSGVYERDNDHYLDVVVKPDAVEIKSVNFLSSETSGLIEFTNPDFKGRHLPPAKDFGEGWAKPILAKLYASIGISDTAPIKPSSIEGHAESTFNISYHASTNSLILSKEKCLNSADKIFYVQFYPVHSEDRMHNTFLWNGYHFYATKTDTNKDECIAVVPLPDYPYKYILTGQLNNDRKQFWQVRLESTSVPVRK